MVDAEDLECPACPLCQGHERDVAYASFSPYAVVRCRSCGVHYLLPRLAEATMLRMYQDDAYFEGGAVGYASYVEQANALRATFRRLLANLHRRNLTGGTLLEVGCGCGYLLEQAAGFFEVRVGTEYSPGMADQARGRADRVYKGGIAQVPAGAEFDCIIATHVIEHVYEPRPFLEKLLEHLKRGGRMVIATPDMGSLWRSLLGPRWPSFKVPEHVVYFDERSLSALMCQVGLEDVRPLPYPHAFPLTLVAEKLGVRLPKALSRFRMWLPATTLALYGKSPGG